MNSQQEILQLYLKKRNKQPKEFSFDKLLYKGFFDDITIQDFTIRGRQVLLNIKLRKWMSETVFIMSTPRICITNTKNLRQG